MITVSELNEYLRLLMDSDPILASVYVRGEISNFKAHSSGHFYLTLKDEDGQLRAVMFRSYALRLAFRPSDGMKVIARGRVSVYGATGQYQLYIEDLQPDGAGALALRYEQLKRKLESEGLFDERRKRPLPSMPMRVGVITSPTGAAVQDIRNILGRRFPCAEMILFPSAVQGAEAPEQLCLGLAFFAAAKLCDVIIIGRGGGSAEDLWAFNDENVVRAVAASPIPVISAVGHESDFTLCDFAADRRAPTPSAAAELAVPDKTELMAHLQSVGSRIYDLTSGCIAREKRYFSQLAQATVFRRPERVFDSFRMKISEREDQLERLTDSCLVAARNRLQLLVGKLEAMNPLSVLLRGYTAVQAQNGTTLTRAAEISVGDALEIRFADGIVCACATDRKGIDEYGC